MTERDNNNPHEGFGFMAFRANKLMEKQDTIITLLKTINHYQSKMYARMFNVSEAEAQSQFQETFDNFLLLETGELERLQKEDLVNFSEQKEDENEQ